MQSRICRPSANSRTDPLPRITFSGGAAVFICVNGCQIGELEEFCSLLAVIFTLVTNINSHFNIAMLTYLATLYLLFCFLLFCSFASLASSRFVQKKYSLVARAVALQRQP